MILCCGEALIDMIPSPSALGRDGFVPHSGGAIFNTAIGLGRLGVKTAMLSGISRDLFGRQLVAGLEASQVDTSLLIRSERPTTLAFVQLTDGQASYVFYDENSAGRQISTADLPDLPAEIEALYFGGISLCVDPAASAYLALARREAERRVIMLDPNIRPGFIQDIEAYRQRLADFIGLADIVKVSDEDLNWIYPGPQSLDDKMDRLLQSGPKIAVLTRGEDGASAVLQDGSKCFAPVEKVNIVDTVGAGDTFNSGLLAMLWQGGHLSKAKLAEIRSDQFFEALEFATKIAAITVSRAGANPPWHYELGDS